MRIVFSRVKFTSVLVFVLVYAVGALGFSGVRAEQDAGEKDTINVEELTQRIKRAIMQELRESDFLRKEIDLGIQRYVEKQREALRAAQAERARIASEKAKNVRRVAMERDHIYGNPDAEISLIEYSDFECPYCKRFHPTAKQVVEDSGGRVNWVYRHYPLSFHNPGAQKQAEASECANELGGNEAFWTYTDAIYARTTSNGKGFPVSQLVPLAKEIGLDETAFQTCLESGRYTARVQEDFVEGSQAGITGTPGNILLHNETGEVRVLTGAVPIATVKAAIARLLK
jgi:protein-disulfide isomerase